MNRAFSYFLMGLSLSDLSQNLFRPFFVRRLSSPFIGEALPLGLEFLAQLGAGA
jgi:hypothetical protein